MKSRKEILIETLHGSIDNLKNLPSAMEDIDIYDETGHVDTEFFTEALVCVNEFMAASNMIVQSLSSLLAPDVVGSDRKHRIDTGSKWSVEEILQHCKLENNVMKLPEVQLSKKSYAEAKKWIEEAGGSWQGGKVQGFVFPFNPQRVFAILNAGKRCNLKQEYQFFATPADLCDWLVSLSGGICPDDRVLEPSAGQGNIVKAVHRVSPESVVDCYELMPENVEILSKLPNVNIKGGDFTRNSGERYSKIIANPPFSKNQDVRHVRMMYELLVPGGVVVSVMSKHWTLSTENICLNFRDWIKEIGAQVHDVAGGAFKESGTEIPTCVIVIKKAV